VLEREREQSALEQREPDGGITRELIDPAGALLALLLQLLELGDHDREQLEDDRRADIGHDAQ